MVTDVCVKLWLPRKQREVLLESEEGSRGGASWREEAAGSAVQVELHRDD
jgi:hypothetical protein